MKARRRARPPRLPIGNVSNGHFEVHEHSFVSGPNAGWSPSRKVVHSHEGGDQPHQHPHTGPAVYTIDKDEWERRTGMKGGGRKKFTKTPVGEQLPVVELEDWQKHFEIVLCQPTRPEGFQGEGPGTGPAARMLLGFRMTATIRQAP